MVKRYLIHVKTDMKRAREACINRRGVQILHCHKHFPFIVATIENVQLLSNHPAFSRIEEDIQISVHRAIPTVQNQLASNVPWNIQAVHAPDVWDKSTGKGIRVGVLDTGIARSHPAFRSQIAGGYNIISDNGNFEDDNGHGTHVSGIIAARKSGSLYGVSPGVDLYGIKVMDRNGSGRISDIIRGIEWAIDNNIQVLNMSLGSSNHTTALEYATRRAHQKGMVLVASAGNNGERGGSIDYPARFPSVISVGAVDREMKRASFSSTGSRIDMMAPGVAIKSAWKGGGYKELSGTSMAAPHVSGGAALLLGLNSNRNGARAQGSLVQLSKRLGPRREYGHGVLDLSLLK
ncbi:S8 family peptidase [Aneurinibacillus sp. Ricciae_BoGa-3]|uniref:S8 family peptidase n=1 Tax=Aneurinibacillus sp. Ricciae_BoGa-3 TaxID=3022697 RepID=UPI0023402B8E|nr:S8 family peptidase [Aneurinibacillus sp. Ricciae_BoGa-3]WCK52525.1 S8 family peptidase [Aneurinibacillus sp. Ricciae_BoGa-3]